MRKRVADYKKTNIPSIIPPYLYQQIMSTYKVKNFHRVPAPLKKCGIFFFFVPSIVYTPGLSQFRSVDYEFRGFRHRIGQYMP